MTELPNILCAIKIINHSNGKTIPDGGVLAIPAKATVRYIIANDGDKPAGPFVIVGALYRNDVKVQPGGQPNVVPAQTITLQPGQVWKVDFPLTEDGSGGSHVAYRASVLGDVGKYVRESNETDNLMKRSFSFQKPDPCEPIRQEILALEDQIEKIQSSPDYIEGPDAPRPGKPAPAPLAKVKALAEQVRKKGQQFHACKLKNGGQPDVAASFAATATLTISDSRFSEPIISPLTIGLMFHKWEHTTFDVTSFPPIVEGPFPVPGGSNTTTVTKTHNAIGTCNPSTGFLQITVTLHFEHSHPAAGDSDITFVLSTETASLGGSRLDASGNITVAGTAIFQGGFLGGERGTLVVSGEISPRP